MIKMQYFPFIVAEKFLKKYKIRSSKEAKILFLENLEEHAKKIAREAIALSKHASRKTILKEDVEFAFKIICF